ncbi:NAD(P)H-hydrate dehydratase [Candidatus Daviesbacteria bacterium]|nr:NAD(P)H-hydrate dehydratase [Candidatus Daviesbacteria bacterium]
MSDNLVTEDLIKKVVKIPDPDSHKGQNGRILIIGSSPLFHGAGGLALSSTLETINAFASLTNDMVYFASTPENLQYLKGRQQAFIGITRDQIDNYLRVVNVVLIGPGLMREEEPNLKETKNEPFITKELTLKVLSLDKKSVLDAGSLQVISPEDLKGKSKVIITPHRKEMANLFDMDEMDFITSYKSSDEEINKVAEKVQALAKDLGITILLKGPIDIVANKDGWYYSKGGNAGMAKGGTGDVLAGVVAALYTNSDNPLEVSAAGSYITKKAGEALWEEKLMLYNATDLVNALAETIVKILK